MISFVISCGYGEREPGCGGSCSEFVPTLPVTSCMTQAEARQHLISGWQCLIYKMGVDRIVVFTLCSLNDSRGALTPPPEAGEQAVGL